MVCGPHRMAAGPGAEAAVVRDGRVDAHGRLGPVAVRDDSVAVDVPPCGGCRGTGSWLAADSDAMLIERQQPVGRIRHSAGLARPSRR